MDIGNIFQNVRKAEAMFLPLLPESWRATPPSYRAILPLLIWFARRKRRFRWAEPALKDFEDGYLVAYHKKGFALEELQPRDVSWLRGILLVALMITVIGLLPFATHFSFPIKVGLLLGGAALLVRGSMEFGPGPFWISWTLAFHCTMMLAPSSSYAAVRILSACGVIWTVAIVCPHPRWRIIDIVGTTPILSLWYRAIENTYLPGHPLWHSGLGALALWVGMWLLLGAKRLRGGINVPLQFVWTGSLFVLGVTRPMASFLHAPPLLVCIFCLASVCVIMGILTPTFRRHHELFRARTIVSVFAVVVALILLSAKDADKAGWSDSAIDYASGWLWPVWWIAGASLVVAAYKASHRILEWLVTAFPVWFLPSVVWIVGILAWNFGRLSHVEYFAGDVPALIIVGIFAGVATFLALRRRKRGLHQWLFWGLFAFFMFSSYWAAASDLANYKEKGAAVDQGRMGYLGLTVWLMWLALVGAQSWRDWVRDSLTARRGIILAAGAFLWLLLAQLWSTQVDHFTELGGHVPLRQRINLELLHGATFLGIVLLVREMIRERDKSWKLTALPWGAILLCGVVVTQIGQGVEHWNYARTQGYSFNALQVALHEAASISLNQGVPNLEISAWWRVLRWLVSACAIAGVLFRWKKPEYRPGDFILTGAFTSLAVATAEVIWIDWPGFSNEWSPLFRPWYVSVVAWNLPFMGQCIIYGLAGCCLGLAVWLFHAGPYCTATEGAFIEERVR